MATIVMLATATRNTSFCTSRFPENFDRSKNESRMAIKSDLTKEHYARKVDFRKMRNLPKKDKIRLRRIKNSEAAKASREKAKLHEQFLEQRLSDLQYEKMKLLLEKEALTKQNMELLKENSNLKNKVCNRNFLPLSEETSCRSAFIQASFVNIPQQKEWVISKIFIILLVLAWEALNQSLIIQSVASLNNQKKTLKNNKYLMQFLYHLQLLIVQLTSFSHSFLLLNG